MKKDRFAFSAPITEEAWSEMTSKSEVEVQCNSCMQIRSITLNHLSSGLKRRTLGCLCTNPIEKRFFTYLSEICKRFGLLVSPQYKLDGLKGVGGYPLRSDFGILDDDQNCRGIIEVDGGYHFGCAGDSRVAGIDYTVEHDFRKEAACLERGIRMVRFSNDLISVDEERWIRVLESELKLIMKGDCPGVVRFSQTSCYVDSVYASRRKGTRLEVSDKRLPLVQPHCNPKAAKFPKMTPQEFADVSSDEESN